MLFMYIVVVRGSRRDAHDRGKHDGGFVTALECMGLGLTRWRWTIESRMRSGKPCKSTLRIYLRVTNDFRAVLRNLLMSPGPGIPRRTSAAWGLGGRANTEGRVESQIGSLFKGENTIKEFGVSDSLGERQTGFV